MSRSLSDLIGPIGKLQRPQKLYALLYSVEDRIPSMRYIFRVGNIFFCVQIAALFMGASSQCVWKSDTIKNTLIGILNSVFSFWTTISSLQDLDYLAYSLFTINAVYYAILITILYFLLSKSTPSKIALIPLSLIILGTHVLMIPSAFALVAFFFFGNFSDHIFQFILCLLSLFMSFFATYIEYIIQFGIPKKDAMINLRSVAYRYCMSLFYFILPNVNLYLTNKVAISAINGVSITFCAIYLYYQIRFIHPPIMLSYTLASIAGYLLNILNTIFDFSGETFFTFYLIIFNIGLVILFLTSYFTQEYILVPLRETIQSHTFQKLDKYSNSMLEQIIILGAEKFDMPVELLDYLEMRAPDNYTFNEIIFLMAKELGNEDRMKKALDTMVALKPSNSIRKVRLCYFEYLIRPTFISIRAQALLKDYSNTLGMFWNEIVNDNAERLISLSNEVADNFLELTNIFHLYGKTGKLAPIFEELSEITQFKSEMKNQSLQYALVTRSGNKNEQSTVYSHCSQYIIIYIAFFLYTFNLAMNSWIKHDVGQMWDASFYSYRILQSINCGSFIVSLMKMKNELNLTNISDYVYDDSLFRSKLENSTDDLNNLINGIENYTNQLKKYAVPSKFDGIVYKWFVSPFNVTRLATTVETAISYVASSFQSIASGEQPHYEGLYIKDTTKLIIYSRALNEAIGQLSDYAVDQIEKVEFMCRIEMITLIILCALLLWTFMHLMSKSMVAYFQPLFKLSKTDLIQKTRDLMTWVKEAISTTTAQIEDNNARYNRELIISKTHTHSKTNKDIEKSFMLQRLIPFLLFVAITWAINEYAWYLLTNNSMDIGISSYGFLLSQQLLKIGQLFMLAANDVAYDGETMPTFANVLALDSFKSLSNSKINEKSLQMLNSLNSKYTLQKSPLLHETIPEFRQTSSNNDEGTCKARTSNRVANNIQEFSNQKKFNYNILETQEINETATVELREQHKKNLYEMISFARQMVLVGVDKFASNTPEAIDVSLYLTMPVDAPLDQRALFVALEVESLNILDFINNKTNRTSFQNILYSILYTSTMFTHKCEESLTENLTYANVRIGFILTLSAIITIAMIALMIGYITSSGSYWLTFDVVSRSIISTLPKTEAFKGNISDTISFLTREEEMKKSSAVIVDLLNSDQIRDELLECHMLLDYNEVIIRSSGLIEDMISSQELEGMKFIDAIRSCADIELIENAPDEGAIEKILFRPHDEKKKDQIIESLKYKLNDIEIEGKRVKYVCVVRDKTREYEAAKMWRNELNQLKLLGLQFIPPDVYEALAGQESFSSVQVNNAFVATFYIDGLDTIEIIQEVKTIIIQECKEYHHLWPVARSTMAVKIYSGLLDQNISHFRALITLLAASIKIAKRISECECEPHCVVSKVKATHAAFSLDSPPIFEMRDDNPFDLILAMGSPAHKISISRDPYEILYNTGIPIEFSFYFRSEGFHKISYETLQDIEFVIEREQAQLTMQSN